MCMMCVRFVIWSFLFFFKQKTAYEMRISDWSSDVCSSDLARSIELGREMFEREAKKYRLNPTALLASDDMLRAAADFGYPSADDQIGRASCRERVCQYV